MCLSWHFQSRCTWCCSTQNLITAENNSFVLGKILCFDPLWKVGSFLITVGVNDEKFSLKAFQLIPVPDSICFLQFGLYMRMVNHLFIIKDIFFFFLFLCFTPANLRVFINNKMFLYCECFYLFLEESCRINTIKTSWDLADGSECDLIAN